ncbi:unnamed protein product [Pleuronectes platessa]|uniref:Uncharacterized protein n=1 Tax=Pleuronectes platessa TaxID=8262 RepID=A0A9N7V7L7_PLEPL|nr:unnamed protein product [Pleuronectes platessa]
MSTPGAFIPGKMVLRAITSKSTILAVSPRVTPLSPAEPVPLCSPAARPRERNTTIHQECVKSRGRWRAGSEPGHSSPLQLFVVPPESTRGIYIVSISRRHTVTTESLTPVTRGTPSSQKTLRLQKQPPLKAAIHRPPSMGRGRRPRQLMNGSIFGANVFRGDLYCDKTSVNTLCRERALKIGHLKAESSTKPHANSSPPTDPPHKDGEQHPSWSVQHWPHY